MFEYLDALVARSTGGVLSWEQTASFEVAGETYAMRQTRGRGIHKPRQLGAGCAVDHDRLHRVRAAASLSGHHRGGRLRPVSVRRN